MIRQLVRGVRPSANGWNKTHGEEQYLQLIRDILHHGVFQDGRNGRTKQIFGASMCFPLNKEFPLLTTKRVAWKTCLRELLWFIRGSTDNKELQAKKVTIWNANGSREFLDSRGLHTYTEDDLGPVYGYQWRRFNRPYTPIERNLTASKDDTMHSDPPEEKEKYPDQLQEIIRCLKDPEKRHSRRLIMTAWNPCQLDEMALPPCHILSQFHVEGNRLSCALYQRSADVGLGMPFNIASYSFLTYLLAHHCGLVPHEFIYFVGNAHIYEDHIPVLEEQCLRTPLPFPTVSIDTLPKQNIEDYTEDNIAVHAYKHHGVLRMNMVA